MGLMPTTNAGVRDARLPGHDGYTLADVAVTFARKRRPPASCSTRAVRSPVSSCWTGVSPR
jgi:hypothetical protein